LERRCNLGEREKTMDGAVQYSTGYVRYDMRGADDGLQNLNVTDSDVYVSK